MSTLPQHFFRHFQLQIGDLVTADDPRHLPFTAIKIQFLHLGEGAFLFHVFFNQQVVVCQGAGNSRVRLQVMETVAVLTGLSSERISVVQWKQ